MHGFVELFDYSARQNRKIENILEQIKEKQKQYENMEIEDFKNITNKLKKRVKEGETLENIKIDAYAAIAEAFKKLQKQKNPGISTNGYYDEQIKASLALADGDLVQMLTGEGKTYALTLSAYLSALEGKGVHILTANEYLAERDYEDNKELFAIMGLKSSFVKQEDTKENKKRAYDCDITYATPTTIAFDYLRDNMEVSKEGQVMRGLHACILDEVDASLIDEASNPYIIAKEDAIPEKVYKDVNQIIQSMRGKVVEASLNQVYKDSLEMEEDTAYLDYVGSKNDRNIFLTDVGIERVNRRLKSLGYENKIKKRDGKEVIIEPQEYMNAFIRNALIANYLMENKNDYVVQEENIKVVNKETGRIAVQSSFGGGIHQAIEAKENLPITSNSMTLNTINQPNLFKLYTAFSGLSGTLLSSKKELSEIYHKNIVAIRPRKGMNRIDEESIICQSKMEKDKEIVREVKKAKAVGQPVLIGTESIEESERISKLLKENNVENRLLNATNPEEEAEIIARAGEVGAITVTTNMAGRGTDIKVSMVALQKGGLYVIGSSLNESQRVDDQLRGRSGRQGNIGKSKFIISLEDTIFKKRYIPEKLKQWKEFLKGKTSKEKQNAVRKFQKKIEADDFESRRYKNAIESIDANIREGFDKTNEEVRTSKNIESILLSMVKGKLEKDSKTDAFVQKYSTLSTETEPKKIAKDVLNSIEKALKEEKQKIGTEKLQNKIRENIIKASRETWITFINNAENQQIAAQMHSSMKGTSFPDEYLDLRLREWAEQIENLQDQIIQNVVQSFSIQKERKQKVEEKTVTHDDIVTAVAAMFFHKDKPEKIVNVQKMWQEHKHTFSPMDKQLVESSIKVATKKYIQNLKNTIMHIETSENLTVIESQIQREIIPVEEIESIQTLLAEVKQNIENTNKRANHL